MKYLKTYQQVKEASLQNLATGLGLAAASTLASCEKPQGVELSFKFGEESGQVVTNSDPDAEIDYVGKKAYLVNKEDVIRDYENSPQWIYSELPTPEQLSILASYRNYQREIDPINNPADIQVGQKVKFYDLADVEVSKVDANNVPPGKTIIKDPYYKTAFEWCKDNQNVFQNDLTHFESSPKPKGLLGELTNYDSSSILNNPNNKPK